MNEQKKVLTRKQVSEMTGLGITTILRLTQKGEIECFRASYPRGRTFYYKSDILAFMEKQREKQKKQVELKNKKNEH
ncbi:MAG: helix-turn-helix transcriptional regulator [Putridiphycobacter sp.]